MSKPTLIDDFLAAINMEHYSQTLRLFGISTMEDIFLITVEEWAALKILPFHRSKIIHAAANMKQNKVKEMQKKNQMQNVIHQYKFSSSGAYHALHKAENLKNFDPQGYGLASSNDCFMKFSFQCPTNIYGMVIGNNVGVSGGWGNTYLQEAQIQVKTTSSPDYKTVHTIKGMPNTANTAYLAKIQSNNVQEVKIWKASYFSTSFIHFI